LSQGEGGGRPLAEIDEPLFWKLIAIPFAKEDAIADILNISPDTLVRWIKKTQGVSFADLKKQKTEGLRARLLSKQYEEAMNGNTSMLIWLGKQWLEQADKVEQKQQIETKTQIEYVTDFGQPMRNVQQIDEEEINTLPSPSETNGDPSEPSKI
jgi:hypothetical protein